MPDIVPLAESLYKGAIVDPAGYGPRARIFAEQARREGAIEALVVALRAQAWAEHAALHNGSALALLDEGVALAGRHGLDHRLGELLLTRGAVHHELGALGAAQRDLDRAARLVEPARRADLLHQQAALLQNIGRLQEAAALYARLLQDPVAGAAAQLKALNNLALIETERGRSALALQLIDRAAALAPALGPRFVAGVAQSAAWITMQSGRLAQSLEQFERAGRLSEAAGLPVGEHHLEYSDALAGLRLLPEALVAARHGLAELPEDEAPLMAAEALLRVARLCMLAGDVDQARSAADRGAALLRRQGRRGWLARMAVVSWQTRALAGPLHPGQVTALRRSAQVLEDSGMRTDAVSAWLLAGRVDPGPRALQSLRSAERLARRAPVLVRLQGRVASSIRAERAGSPGQVLRACRAGLADLDGHRDALPSMELRARASAHGSELGSSGLRVLLPTGSPARVFGWLERTRAAALAPLATPPEDHHLEPELAALGAAYAELAALSQQGAAEPAELLARVADAEAEVRRASWSGPAGTGSSAARASASLVRGALGDAVLVEYGELDGTLLAVVLDRRRSALVELGPASAAAADIDALLFALRRLSRRGGSGAARDGAARSATACLDRLRTRLLGPLGIDPAAPLVVVPVGGLQRAPWAPLHAGPTTVAPSAAVWLRTRQPGERRTDGVGRVALVAGPDLPGAAEEITLLGGVHPGATQLAPAQATCAATAAAVRDADLAHLACHGRLRADNPAFSFLQLADGPLTVHELSVRVGAPRRVVLAACEAGAQALFPGDEALGFVAALLARGSAGVVASSVLVPDSETPALMAALHGRLAAGSTLAQGLHAARALFDPADPDQLATWCAFDAYGAA